MDDAEFLTRVERITDAAADQAKECHHTGLHLPLGKCASCDIDLLREEIHDRRRAIKAAENEAARAVGGLTTLLEDLP